MTEKDSINANEIPSVAMVIVAHPDDAEFTVAGTIAAWVKAGCRAVYVICTDGNAGSHEKGMTPRRLCEIRRAEQTAACQVVGVQDIEFLGYDDGQLEPSLMLRRDLVRVIRHYQPEVVITWDPRRLFSSNGYINHPDHRAASQATVDAIAPACAMPLLWPDAGEAHRVHKLLVHGVDDANFWVDISDTVDQKIEALKKHVSQLGDWDPSERIRERSAETGRPQGLAHAEAYRAIQIYRPSE